MAELTGYWWQCICDHTTKQLVNETGGIASYIRDRLIASGWDQNLLERPCPACNKSRMRITYDFPRNKAVRIQVLHMVGLDYGNSEYVPMLWETAKLSDPEESMFHFNYITGRNPWGLNRAAVLELEEIKNLLELYKEKTGKPLPFKFDRDRS